MCADSLQSNLFLWGEKKNTFAQNLSKVSTDKQSLECQTATVLSRDFATYQSSLSCLSWLSVLSQQREHLPCSWGRCSQSREQTSFCRGRDRTTPQLGSCWKPKVSTWKSGADLPFTGRTRCCLRPCQPRHSFPMSPLGLGRDGPARCSNSSCRLIPFTAGPVCSRPTEHRRIVVEGALTESKTMSRL